MTSLEALTPDDKAEAGDIEIPIPEGYFREIGIGSRATFQRWEKAGLRILRIGGRRFCYRSELRDFLEERNTNV